MAKELKTKKNNASVKDFINAVEDEQKRKDSFDLLKIFEEITKEKAKMWGASIIGFGQYHYKYASGQEGDWMITGFSPRKQQISLYIMSGVKNYEDLIAKLGKNKTGKAKCSSSCLYVKKLEDIDIKVLKEIIKKDYVHMKKKYDIK